MGSSGDSEPQAPAYQTKTYTDGFGDSATQDSFSPSAYNQNQMNYVQGVTPQLESKLYDTNAADSSARKYADSLKSTGMKSLKLQSDDLFGGYQADNKKRFGGGDNSDYDGNMKTFSKQVESGLQNLGTQYDSNYQNGLNSYKDYYTGLLSTASGIGSNLYNLASGQSQNAMNSSNAVNNFNNSQYQSQLAQYNTNKQMSNSQNMMGMGALMGSANGLGSLFGSLGSLGGSAGTAGAEGLISYAPEAAMMIA